MFCVKEFADGGSVARYFGSAAVVIAGINTAVIDAAKKRAGSSVALPTFATGELQNAPSRKPLHRCGGVAIFLGREIYEPLPALLPY